MVERTKADFVDRFVGTVVDVSQETSQNPDIEQLQYHIQIEPEDKTLLKESKTGRFHEWIRITAKAEDNSVPEGSVLDRYLAEVELLFPDCKGMKSHKEVMEYLKGKKLEFLRKKLGKSFGGNPAKEYWTPVSAK